MFNRSLGYFGVEILCLAALGILIDIIAACVKIDVGTSQWFLVRLFLIIAASVTFMPPIVDKIYEKLTGKGI